MKTTMPLWVGLTMLMGLLVLGASFQFLYMELNEQRNAVLEIEGTIAAQNETAQLVEGTIVALGDQLTQQAVPLADYAATGTAQALPVEQLSEEPTITATVDVTSVVSDPTPTLSPSIPEDEETPFAIPSDVTATPVLPPADAASSSVAIIFPTEGETLSIGEELFLDTVILDESGVSQAWLAVNGIELKRFSINDFPEFNYTPLWIPEEAGEYELTVGAVNSQGLAIEPARVNVTVGNSASADG